MAMARVLGTTITVMLFVTSVTSMPQIHNIADDATVNPVDLLLRHSPANIAEQFAKDLMKSMNGIRHHCEEMEADVEQDAESSIQSLSEYQEHINDIMNSHHQNMSEDEKLAIQNNFRRAFQEIFEQEQAKENKIAMNCTKEFEEIMMKKMTVAVDYCKTLFQQSTSEFTSLIESILDYSTRLQSALDECMKQYPPTEFDNPLKIGSPSYRCKQIEIQILSQFVNELVIRSTTGLLTSNSSDSTGHGHVVISSLIDQIPEIFPRPPTTPSAKPSTDDIELIPQPAAQDIDTTSDNNEDNAGPASNRTHFNHHGNHGGHHHGNHGGHHHGNHGGHHHGNHGGHHHGSHSSNHHGNHGGNHHGNHGGNHHGNHGGNHHGSHGGHHHGNRTGHHHGGHHGNHHMNPGNRPRPSSTYSHSLRPSSIVESFPDIDTDRPSTTNNPQFDYVVRDPTNTAETPSAIDATEGHKLFILFIICGGVSGVLLILILITCVLVLYLKYCRYDNQKWSQLTEDEKVVVMKKSGYINPTYEFFDKVTATN